MTNRNTRRAFLASLMALILCVSSLLGTTYAWFTDEVTSANNIISSGNLDIELEYWNGTEWKDVKGASDILTNTLWEPGVTEVAYLRVANAGSLALKYQLGINIVSETAGVNKAGASFKLSDYIQFGVVENVNGETGAYANREAAVAAVTGAKKISAGYTKADSMTAGTELYLALVVWMPTDVGNVANHNGTDVPVINLGLGVKATQVASEGDSFDKYYDGATPWYGAIDTSWYNTTDTEFVIGTAEELAGLAQLVNTGKEFAGTTIKLASNIDLNNLAWTPIGNWSNAFAGNFDGNGYAINNLSINAPEGEGVGLFGVVENSTIKGVTLNNVDVEAYSMVSALVGAAYPAIISDCHVTGDIEIVAEWAYVSGIACYCYYGTQVDGCSVVADDKGLIKSETRNGVGGITAWLLEGNHKVTNCDVANLDLVGWTNVGAITGFVHYSNTIEGCSVKNVTLTKTRVDGNPGIGLIAGGYSYNANHATTLKNNAVDTVTLYGTHVAYSSYNTLYGSEYGGVTDSNFVLENNTVENITNKLIEVKTITDAAGLKDALSNGGDNYVLTKDITVAKNETLTVANGTTVAIDLNGYTISSTADKSGNQELFLVKGDLTVTNGSLGYVASNNQAWGAMITIFDVTAGGSLTMDKVTAKVAGSDMNFIVHLNNWGEVTLDVNECDFTASYTAVRVFNSGPDMNNVTITNTASHGGRFLWVHNYTSADMSGKVYSGASAAYDEAVVANRLNFTLSGNTSDNDKPIRIAMTGATYYTLDGKQVVTAATQNDLNSAISANGGKVSVALGNGNYSMPTTNGDVTISGTKDTVISGNDATANKVTFNGVTIQSTGAQYVGIKHSNTVIYNDATIVGNMYLYAENVEFNNCTFDLSNTNDYIWIYGATNVTFTNCTFNTMGKAILVYQDGSSVDQTVTVEDCTFNASAPAYNWNHTIHISAVSIDGSQGGTYNVILNNNTVDSDFNGLWQDKTAAGNIKVTVDGTIELQ